jgi:WD40 repeat protein
MNKYLVTMALALGIVSSQATRLYITFENADNSSAHYERDFVAAEPVTADLLYDHVRLTFVDDNSEVFYVVPRRVIQELAPYIDELFESGISVEGFFDSNDFKQQHYFYYLNAQSFGLVMRLDKEGRDATNLAFTQESLDRFVKTVTEEGLKAGKATFGCETPVTLALMMANVLGHEPLYSRVANQLMALATTDEYLRMSTPADVELINQLGGFLCGHDSISEAYNRMLIPFLITSKKFVGHTREVYSVAYSPDGKHIVSGGRDETIRIWNATTGAQEGLPFTGHTDPVYSVAYSPDGKHIVSGGFDNTIRIWNVATGVQEGLPLTGHTDPVLSVAYSPDGKHIVSGSYDRTVRIWNATAGVQEGLPLTGHTDAVRSVAYSPDGKNIVSGSRDRTVRIWNATTGVQEGLPLTGHTNAVDSVAYSPDGKHIVSGSWDNTIRIWNTTTGVLERTLIGNPYGVTSVAYSPDGKNIVSGSDDGTIRIWDVTIGVQEELPLTGHTGSVYSVAYSPDGKHIVSGSDDRTIRKWNAGDELDGLNTREQWHMLVRNAKVPFKDRDDALVTAREIVAARKAREKCCTGASSSGSSSDSRDSK